MGNMFRSGIDLDMVCYNTLINLYYKEGKLEDACNLLDEAEKMGFECDKYTHVILIDGLCKAGNVKAAQRHLKNMNMMGFGTNLVVFDCFIDGLCKLGQVDYAMQVFESLKLKDEFTYSSMVGGLCRVGRFHLAAKQLQSCIESGMRIIRSDKRAVICGLRSLGFHDEAKKLQSKI
ncbi:hypothetical protein ACH5RR_028512 [Cinchona calisaya]|uniref:Pentatricopeptide repeat-containing protein n=1 Tax=Cinchona calisaya TaxID=153742 RepID=A0ABD2YR77_9GENT